MTDAPYILYDRPILVIDPGMHTAAIRGMDTDELGEIVVTASQDKTVRVWSAASGKLVRTIRLPQGPFSVGWAYAAAVSPDGHLCAVGGWTRTTEADPQEQIYIFNLETGEMVDRIEGLPNVVVNLAFSPDGQRFAATLWGGAGLRIYRRSRNDKWLEIARHDDYGSNRCCTYGAAFARDGRLATTSEDGWVRLYNKNGTLAEEQALGGQLAEVVFSPEGNLLAMGLRNHARPEVQLCDGHDLSNEGTVCSNFGGELPFVCWSWDGETIFAGGTAIAEWGGPPTVFAWDKRGYSEPRVLPVGTDTITGLRPLKCGDLLATTTEPRLTRLGPEGRPKWAIPPVQLQPLRQAREIAVSVDGLVVDFRYSANVEARMRIDLETLTLEAAPNADGRTNPPLQDSRWWENDNAPGGDRYRAFAMHPKDSRFVLGTDRYLSALRGFEGGSTELWRIFAPGSVGAANVSGDGRFVVAAYTDGTIRWHAMDDGNELLAFFPFADEENWVAWTPEGIYAATPGARGALRWHVNRGWDSAGTAVPASAIAGTYRPEVIPHVLPQMGTARAIGVADLAKVRAAVQRETGSDTAPGKRLHVLAIGVSDYGDTASHLTLTYAHQDARDIAAALVRSQSSLYAAVLPSVLVNGEATRMAIFGEFAALQDAMQRGGGKDIAVVLFSGHGDMVGERFYLLPHGVDSASPSALKASALSITDFHDEVAGIARHGRVLVFLDACRSGSATLPADRSLRALLAASNVSVFTSSSPGENSLEDASWQNGAFTEALLEALRRDPDGDSLIRISDIAAHLSDRVPDLTQGRQHPEVELHLEARVFSVTA